MRFLHRRYPRTPQTPVRVDAEWQLQCVHADEWACVSNEMVAVVVVVEVAAEAEIVVVVGLVVVGGDGGG
jgi:hypothetical protein